MDETTLTIWMEKVVLLSKIRRDNRFDFLSLVDLMKIVDVAVSGSEALFEERFSQRRESEPFGDPDSVVKVAEFDVIFFRIAEGTLSRSSGPKTLTMSGGSS